MLVVDPRVWLNEDGSLPTENLRIRRRMLWVARLIEYGGRLEKLESRETLVECRRRPKGHPCAGLLWVTKTERDDIEAFCLVCKTEEATIQNWQGTEWDSGMMEPVSPQLDHTDAPNRPQPSRRN